MMDLPPDEIEFLNCVADGLVGNANNYALSISRIPTWVEKNQIGRLARELRYLRQSLNQFEIPFPGLTGLSLQFSPNDPASIRAMAKSIALCLPQPRDQTDRRKWLEQCCIGAVNLRGTICIIQACAPCAIALAENRSPPIDSTPIATVAAQNIHAPTLEQVEAAIRLADRLEAIAKLTSNIASDDNSLKEHEPNNVSNQIATDKNPENKSAVHAKEHVPSSDRDEGISTKASLILVIALGGGTDMIFYVLADVFGSHGHPQLQDLCRFFVIATVLGAIALTTVNVWPRPKVVWSLYVAACVSFAIFFYTFYGGAMPSQTPGANNRFILPTVLSVLAACSWIWTWVAHPGKPNAAENVSVKPPISPPPTTEMRSDMPASKPATSKPCRTNH